jgi:imidazolonepropionase-like amidohydrolase
VSSFSTLAIRAGKLYDGTGAAPHTNVTLRIANGVVETIAAGEPLAADRTIEAAAVTPGMINAHVHLEASGEPDLGLLFLSVPTVARTLIAARNARISLEAGVTTVRDLGSADSTAIEVRDAIARGDHMGPYIVAAGRPLCITGGHGHFMGRETDGPWDARKAVREQRKSGAECIKLIATGGVLTKGAVPGLDQLTEEEMRAAITEARTHQMRVAAHAIGTSGIKNALRAGVNSIEHGHLLDDEAIDLFKQNGAYLVPTLAAVVCIFEHIQGGGMPDFVVRKATALHEMASANITKAFKAGVKIAGGSDAGTPYNGHDAFHREVELLHTLIGMTPNQALSAATGGSGDLLGVSAGTLAPGKPADVLVLDGDLESNTLALRAPRIVIKGGTVAFER